MTRSFLALLSVVSKLSPASVTVQFHCCWRLGAGRAGSISAVLTPVGDTCPTSCGQGRSLVKQQLQLLTSVQHSQGNF